LETVYINTYSQKGIILGASLTRLLTTSKILYYLQYTGHRVLPHHGVVIHSTNYNNKRVLVVALLTAYTPVSVLRKQTTNDSSICNIYKLSTDVGQMVNALTTVKSVQ
jgi:hypothetical protein